MRVEVTSERRNAWRPRLQLLERLAWALAVVLGGAWLTARSDSPKARWCCAASSWTIQSWPKCRPAERWKAGAVCRMKLGCANRETQPFFS